MVRREPNIRARMMMRSVSRMINSDLDIILDFGQLEPDGEIRDKILAARIEAKKVLEALENVLAEAARKVS